MRGARGGSTQYPFRFNSKALAGKKLLFPKPDAVTSTSSSTTDSFYAPAPHHWQHDWDKSADNAKTKIWDGSAPVPEGYRLEPEVTLDFPAKYNSHGGFVPPLDYDMTPSPRHVAGRDKVKLLVDLYCKESGTWEVRGYQWQDLEDVRGQ